jgi:putative heme-binding domain-containing protein
VHGVTPEDLERGGTIYMASCAACHGTNGDALPTVDLGAGTFRRGSTDQDLLNIVRNGLPGTPMPPSALSEGDAARVVAYLRSLPELRRGPRTTTPVGSALNGQALFKGKGNCLECHIVGGVGGFLGPNLSSVGLTRRVDEIERALTAPSADIRTGGRAAVVIKNDGTTITGRLLNQDTYSLQLIDARGTLLSIDKSAVRRWDIPRDSVMPNVAERLAPNEIADIVSYLQTLQAPVPVGPGRRGGGPGRGGPAPGGRGGAQLPAGGRAGAAQ